MLADLPAGEVEDWQTQQEHVAATTVQASWRRHKAKKGYGVERQARAAAATKIQGQFRKHRRAKLAAGRPSTGLRQRADDAFSGLTGSIEWDDGNKDEAFSVRTAARQQKTVEQIVTMRKMEAQRELEDKAGDSTVTFETWSEGRQRTRKLLQEYRETAAAAAAAAAARRKVCKQAEGVYRAQRAMRHGSLAELPADASPTQFPSPVGVNEKTTRRLHAEALEAAQVESKWWKPLLSLNREQKVLDQQEMQRGQRVGTQTGAAGYKSNRSRAGVPLTPTKSANEHSSNVDGFGIDAELL